MLALVRHPAVEANTDSVLANNKIVKTTVESHLEQAKAIQAELAKSSTTP